jgi:hypothetical protein
VPPVPPTPPAAQAAAPRQFSSVNSPLHRRPLSPRQLLLHRPMVPLVGRWTQLH